VQSGGHRENAGGLVFLSEADRYVSYEPKGEILIWKVDDTDEFAKFHRPKSVRTDLAHVSGIVHLQHFYNSERLALFSTEKQLTFMDLMRESCKQSGVIKLDFSPYCFNSVNLLSDAGEVIEQALAFGDDRGSVHLFRANDLHRCAEYNLRVPNERGAGESHLRSWPAHDRSAFVYKVEYCADIKLLISCSSDGQVVFSDVEKGCIKGDGFKHRSDVHDFVWLRKAQQLVSCGIERHIKVWQLGLKAPVEKLQGHQTSVHRLLWEGGQLISLDASKVIIVWDMSAMLCVQRLDCVKSHPDYPVCDISYDVRRNTIATLGRSICLWQAADRKAPNGHIHPITCALYNPIFEMVITADDSAEIRVWDLNTGAVIFCFSQAHVNVKGENVKVSAMTFDLTLRRLITGAHDGSAKIWNFSTGQCLGVLDGFGEGEISSMTSMAIQPYNYIVACGWNKKVTFWLDAHLQQPRRGYSSGADIKETYPTFVPSYNFSGHRDDILSMACHHETSLLVTGSFDGDIIIWKVESGSVRTRLILPGILSMQGDQKPIEQIKMIDCGIVAEATDTEFEAPCLVLIATIGGDDLIRIWSSDSSAELLLEVKRIIDSDDHFVDASDLGLVGLCVCSRNKVMVVADTKQYVIVYDISKMIGSSRYCVESRLQALEPPERACKFRSQSGPIVSLKYIGTRHLILICSEDCSILLWTILGEKMGNFGELSEWKLTKEMHHYEHCMDEGVFEGVPGMSSEKVVFGGGVTKSNTRGDQLKGGSMSKKSSSHFATMKRRQSLKNKINLMRGSEFIGARKSINDAIDDVGSFFFTGTAQFDQSTAAEKEYYAEDTAETIEDPVGDALKEFSEYQQEVWTDSEISEADAPEEDAIHYQLKESIDQILSRALSMKERGERFFEPGQPVVPAYQKIRISEISEVELPDNIAKRIILQKGQDKRPSGLAAVKRRVET
jgi:WD40 repeat protein